MAEPSKPPRVKLICGMISARGELFTQASLALTDQFGPVDIASEVMAFDFTSYYDHEMGHPLYRQFVAFDKLVCPDILASAKLATNAIEAEFKTSASQGSPARPINLDVGYIEPAKLILASMKNFSHRIYVGCGVFAEVTLMFHKVGWDAFPWTFPDYASGRYSPFLNAARDKMREQIEQEARP
jgi:hypothetical protein